MPSTHKRPVGRPRSATPTKNAHYFGMRVYPADRTTLSAYSSGLLSELLASGLRLGLSTLPALSSADHQAVRRALADTDISAAQIRALPAILRSQGRAELADELSSLGDWELLVLTLLSRQATPAPEKGGA